MYPVGASDGAGRLGESCTETPDCAEPNQCVVDGSERYCAPACPEGTCPDGYTCLEADTTAVCAKAVGCGCATGGSPGLAALLFGMLCLRARRPAVSRPR